jgi:hypothetical protein
LRAALLLLRLADEGSFRAMPTDDILRSLMMYFVLPVRPGGRKEPVLHLLQFAEGLAA